MSYIRINVRSVCLADGEALVADLGRPAGAKASSMTLENSERFSVAKAGLLKL